MKITRQVQYWALSDQVQGHCRMFFPFTAVQSVRSYNSSMVHSRKLILSMYVHLVLAYKILTDFTNSQRVLKVDSCELYISALDHVRKLRLYMYL